jgi:serine/threonine protein kinase
MKATTNHSTYGSPPSSMKMMLVAAADKRKSVTTTTVATAPAVPSSPASSFTSVSSSSSSSSSVLSHQSNCTNTTDKVGMTLYGGHSHSSDSDYVEEEGEEIEETMMEFAMVKRVSKFIIKRHRRFLESDSYQQLLLNHKYKQQQQQQPNQRQEAKMMTTVKRSQIHFGELLGNGSFSSVYKVKTDFRTSTPCVVKCVGLHTVDDDPQIFISCALGLAREGAIMTAIQQQDKQHPNILRLMAVSETGVEGYATGKIGTTFLVLERLEYLLSNKIRQWKEETERNDRIDPASRLRRRFGRFQRFKPKKNNAEYHTQQNMMLKRLQVALDLANGLDYLHSLRILHRDIKSQNVGFDNNGILKIFDFDVSRILPLKSGGGGDDLFHLTKRVGTRRFMAPEVCLGHDYNLKADVYSYTMVLYQIFALKTPFKHMTQLEHIERIMVGGERPSIPRHCPESVRSLLKKGWSPDISTRPDMATISLTLQQEIEKISTESPTLHEPSSFRRIGSRNAQKQ